MFSTIFLVFLTPLLTTITIIRKFRQQSCRNAKNQRNLLKSLVIQTLIFLLLYIIPKQITSSSLFYDWFNPGVILSCLAVVRCHGSFATISIFLTTPGFRKDFIGFLGSIGHKKVNSINLK
ncbi:unnamed protein product [Caenorhabditis angaria]|uniref:Uncharacterized protein n=1 Tax=Caenorhabditis angaria TaxID=860376 RepID=A0A9P1IT64_9PELO|nr:unnamed protein product [Caenorhabditis angaria]